MLQQDNYRFLQNVNTAPSSSGDKEVIITKLITKVSEQALELTDLTTQLETRSATAAISQSSSSPSVLNGAYYELDHLDLHSKHSNRHLSPSESSGRSARRGHAFDPILSDGSSSSSSHGGVLHYDHTMSGTSSKQPFHSMSFSEAASQRKHDQETHQQLLSLQMQLEASEGRLTEAVKARKKMINELETKSRELRFYAKRCKELESENNLLKAQNESILKMQSMSALKSSERKGAKGHLLKAVDPVVYYKACDDLSFHKKLVEELQVEIEQLREGEQRSVTRTKLLEEALEFRSEEIGLAGHSDLLSKVVKLRNEVNTLKSELSQKHGSTVSGSEEEKEKADTKQQHEVLQRQILQIQARLSKSQQELYTLQHADVHELLRRAEHERDTLLEFVSSDMQKSSDLSQQVDGLQAQLRSSQLNEKTLEVNVERLTKLLSEDKHRSSEAEDRCHTLSGQLQDLSRRNRILEVEKEQLSKQLELKRLEAEEAGKVSSHLHAQSKSKDNELNSLANEVTVLTTQLVEYRIVVPRLEEDNKQLRDRCRSSDSEAQLLRESLGVFESKLHRLEPELKLLRSERESVLQEKYSLEAEATKLRPLGRILVELSRDIAQVNEMFSVPSQVAARSDRNNTLHPSEPSSEVEVVDRCEDKVLPPAERGEADDLLSQKHTLWVGLPSIRALHGGLYENIRRLARDLQEKELQLSEASAKCTSLQREYQKAKADNEHMYQQLSTLQRESSQVIHQLTESNLKSDKEIVKLRGLADIIDQIRSSIVNSYPSSIKQLYSRDSIDTGNLSNVPTYEMKTAESSPSSSKNALSPDHWKAFNREYLSKEIHDKSLSDLVGKIITYSTASVVDFETSQSTIAELQRTVRGLQLQCDELSKYKQDSLQGASAMNSLVHRADERCLQLEKECAEKVTAAVDLAEKQNTLTMSLEAKVEDTCILMSLVLRV